MCVHVCVCECLHSFIRSLVTFMSAIWNIGVICSNLAIMWHAAAWGIPAIRIRSVGRERERRMLLKQHTIIVNISLSFKCLHTQQRNNKNGSAAGTGGGMKPISRHYSYAA